MDNEILKDTDAPATTRRNVIASLLAGGALAASPLLFSRTASAAGETTTTAPNRSTTDNATLNSLVNLERIAVRTYSAAAASTSLSDDDKIVVAALLAHHRAYADALSGHLGPDATTDTTTQPATPNGGVKENASAWIALEERAVTTHTEALASIDGHDASTLVASIISGEARHVAVLALLSGASFAAATA